MFEHEISILIFVFYCGIIVFATHCQLRSRFALVLHFLGSLIMHIRESNLSIFTHYFYSCRDSLAASSITLKNYSLSEGARKARDEK